MRIAAIETSGKTFSVALSENGKVVGEIFWQAGINHSEKLIPALDYLLKTAGWEKESITKIAVTTGPGSFTGIRVGISCARMLAQALKVKIVAIDTLEVIKAGIPGSVPAIDALRNEVFVKNSKNEVEIIGMEKFKARLKKSGKKAVLDAVPRARVLSVMAVEQKGQNYDRIKPMYIRKSWAEERG